jgi:hyperosmotically inducible protein
MTILKTVFGVFIILTSLNAYSQASGTEGSSGASTAAAASHANATPSDAKSKKKAERVANRTLQNDVRRALSRTKGISMADVTVQARDGEVTLRGSMQNQAQVDQAGEVAKGVKGVTAVRNQVRVLSTMGN